MFNRDPYQQKLCMLNKLFSCFIMTSAGQGCRYLNKFVPVKSEHLELQQIESDLKQTYAEASKLSEKFKENALDAESKNWQDPKKRESSLQNLLSNKQEKRKST